MANDINYEVDPNDSRLTSIKSEESSQLSNLESTYAKMETNTDKYYDKQIEGWENYGKEQKDIAERQHELTVQQINQDLADTKKDYIKEQSGAYVDWQKQTAQHGVNAEQMASSGLTNTGFSESSQVSMYNTYQNRVAVARESFIRAETDFKNQITQAQIANDTLLAEIAFDTLQKTTALAIEQAQYKNQLLMDLTEKKATLKQNYWTRYNDMMTAIQREIEQKEVARQYNLSLEQEKKKNKAYIDNLNAETALKKYELEQKQAAGSISGGSGGSSGRSGIGIRGGSKSGTKTSKKGTNTSGIKQGRADAVKAENANDKTQHYTPDMKSIMALGYGPLSAAELDKKIRQGIVQEYKENGKLKYRKVISKGKGTSSNLINLLN